MKKNNKGFTLAEMLIVVAIIGVLIAILIPTFSSQIKKARAAADAGNIRSAYAEYCADLLENGTAENKTVTLKGNHKWEGITDIAGTVPNKTADVAPGEYEVFEDSTTGKVNWNKKSAASSGSSTGS